MHVNTRKPVWFVCVVWNRDYVKVTGEKPFTLIMKPVCKYEPSTTVAGVMQTYYNLLEYLDIH